MQNASNSMTKMQPIGKYTLLSEEGESISCWCLFSPFFRMLVEGDADGDQLKLPLGLSLARAIDVKPFSLGGESVLECPSPRFICIFSDPLGAAHFSAAVVRSSSTFAPSDKVTLYGNVSVDETIQVSAFSPQVL